jgi:lipoate-protein ligase A
MENWRLLDLGALPPLKAQAFYEAVAIALDRGLVSSTVILCYPSKPYACLGYHQEVEEVDLDYCVGRDLPVIRRGQGGGATYLNSDQQFYQIVADEKSPVVPYAVNAFFERFLRPTIYTCGVLGLSAVFKPINDVVVNGRKISGNGAGKVGRASVLVGNVILDLDYDSMARVLKVPDEKFRGKLVKSMRDWVTSLKRELGYVPARDMVKRLLIEGYENIGVSLNPGEITEHEREIFEKEVKPKHVSKEWVCMPELRHPDLLGKRAVKVAGDVRVVQANYKAGKMVKVTMEIASGKILDILISGDFFMIPETILPNLEKELFNASLNEVDLLQRVKGFFERFGVQTPGVKPADIVQAILRAGRE